MPRARLVLLAFASPLGLGVLAACGWDWRVRADDTPDEAGVAGEAGAETGPRVDAGADVTSARDAEAGLPAVDCRALAEDVDRTRKDARACELGKGQCLSTVKDQCDCKVVVAVPGSAKVIAYEQAVAALRASGCALGCASSCPASSPSNCLQQPTEIVCVP